MAGAYLILADELSLLSRGAWIEILITSSCPATGAGRSPHGERG